MSKNSQIKPFLKWVGGKTKLLSDIEKNLPKELKKRNITNGICIVGEPTKMKIIDSHKGCYEYTTYFGGLAGHSSKPNDGVNAAEFASRYVGKLMKLRKELKNRQPKNSIFSEIPKSISSKFCCKFPQNSVSDSRYVLSF